MIFTEGFCESMKGGPVLGSVLLTGGVADLVSEVSVVDVPRKHGMSGRSLCNGNDIRELVRASQNWLSSAEVDGLVDCGAPMVMSYCGVDPFLGRLSDFVLYLPLGGLGLTVCGDVLNISHDTVGGRCRTAVRGWALGSVVAWLVPDETGNQCGVVGIPAVIRWGRV